MLCKSLSHYLAILTAEEPRDETKMQAVMAALLLLSSSSWPGLRLIQHRLGGSPCQILLSGISTIPFGRCDLQVRRYRPVVRRRNLNDFAALAAAPK